jgi:putative membrane protein
MAWVRTAVSLISFGFTIYKFFQGLQDTERIQAAHHLFGPRGFALVMIGLGVGSLVLATIQHRAEMKTLTAAYSHYGPPPRSTSMVVASVVASLGIFALILVILQQ